MSRWRKYFGPSTLVAAAFIGPGTLTICTLAGAEMGYSLLWTLVFAIITTIILQEMAARLGLITQAGLGEAIRSQLKNPLVRILAITLVFLAIILGNGAYEAGNISGAYLGIEAISGSSNITTGSTQLKIWPLLIGGLAFVLLYRGKFKTILYFLIGLVLIMSTVFIITTFVCQPDLGEMLQGLISPRLDGDNLILIIGLIGTTVVPYNLFLHASSVSEKWHNPEDLRDLRTENRTAIIIGGLISMCIIITSAATLYVNDIKVTGAGQMAVQLEPLLGTWAKYFIGIGLFAAGISSAVTAPLAAAYAANGIFGWKANLQDWRMRAVWIFILLAGIIFAMTGYKPIDIIKIAQVSNGLLLPIIAIFLLWAVNRTSILGKYVNNPAQNVLTIVIILITLFIGFRGLNAVFQFL